ncbi:MAG TPA: polynucleotide adenylyltransferase PcnB, partial [Firmicutes bacterium]|nr:polynucleotide adenylyltransferase PcnB [Candidatus Fermentithermobacillaceae bacterium]
MLEQIDLEKIPLKIRAMASAIKEAGGRAFIVGGAVRDMLLGLEPADWDIGTDLEPREILMVFPGASTCGI